MERRLLEVGAHLRREVLVLWVEVLGLVLEVMQWLQRVLQGLVLKLLLLMVVMLVVVLMMMLEVIVVVLTQQMLVHVVRKLLGLIFEELLKLLRGLFVGDEPVLWREEAKPVRGGGGLKCQINQG